MSIPKRTEWWIFKSRWGRRQAHISTHMDELLIQAVRDTVHYDETLGRHISQAIIIATGLMKIPEVKQRYEQLKKEKEQREREGANRRGA